jgi:DNA primase
VELLAFPDSFLQELTERNSIEDVVGDYVKLTKRSGANLFGLCPFHSEKTPSFSVSPDKQIYHCFGCGKGGGVINFIMEIENLSFPDAVQFLANRAGMAVPEEKNDATTGRRRRMLTLNQAAARFFHSHLTDGSSPQAVDYVLNRGISPGMVKTFGLGYAPDSWDSLIQAMTDQGYSRRELIDAGLARPSRKGNGAYDTFRNRLMFPVIDVRGSVIGFSGRILGDGEPKYMNSPETLVFNKSRNLFALNLAKKSKSGYILLSEGNIDVVALHQAGFDGAVASLGTALTAEQARLISRYTDTVIIAYDNDEAGHKASARAIKILEQLDLKVKVLSMEGAKDPDEYIRKKGPDAFANLLAQSENQVEYRLREISGRHDLQSEEGRVAFLRDATGLISSLPGAVQREIYAGKAADLARVSVDAVLSEVNRLYRRRVSGSKRELERKQARPLQALQPKERGIRYENERSAMAEQGLIRLLYLDPSLFSKHPELTGDQFSSPLLGRFFTYIQGHPGAEADALIAGMGDTFTNEEISHLINILQKPEDRANSEKALCDYIDIIYSGKDKQLQEMDLRAYAEKLREKKGYGAEI